MRYASDFPVPVPAATAKCRPRSKASAVAAAICSWPARGSPAGPSASVAAASRARLRSARLTPAGYQPPCSPPESPCRRVLAAVGGPARRRRCPRCRGRRPPVAIARSGKTARTAPRLLQMTFRNGAVPTCQQVPHESFRRRSLRRPGPRGLRHGRERALGGAARPAAHRRPRGRTRRPVRCGRRGTGDRRAVADRLRLLDGELEPPPRGGALPAGLQPVEPGGAARRDARAGGATPLHRRARPPSPAEPAGPRWTRRPN